MPVAHILLALLVTLITFRQNGDNAELAPATH